ncbi:MAG: alpha/beta hydrolase, partial [Bacteroidales bacterium]|nr:alpha/beta hydrolase [Bacteroidales bacterium]
MNTYMISARRLIVAAAAILAFSVLSAQETCRFKPSETLLLYPEGQNVDKGIALGPGESNGLTGDEVVMDWGKGNTSNTGDQARIDLYLPEKPNGQMVIICPGGGYAFTSCSNEGTYVADWLMERNIAACIVRYRMPNGHHNVPLTDVQNAFRYCRANAEKWGVNQIGVIGFSAGGHLAASVSTLYVDRETKPDFSILIYPVISFDWDITHYGTRENLIGTKAELEGRYSLENNVNKRTPATFIALCQDDTTVDPENSMRYYQKLLDFGVPAEIHIWPKGGHGFGF